MRSATKNGKGTRVNEQLRAENARLRAQLKKHVKLLDDDDPTLPALPPADDNGQYPAIETARAIIARQVIRGRKTAGWTQAELAARAGVRQETISRIETGKHSPGLKTMAKIDQALKRAGV
jgi:DNA-binding XRE family transcriptional regulator